MEGIIFLVIFFGGIWLISVVVSKISKAIKEKREKIRDQVAEEVLNGLNIQSVIDSYKKKLEHIKYIRVNPMEKALAAYDWIGGRDAVLLGDCPKCENGQLVIKNGKYGKFLACNKYPKCNFTKDIKHARIEYKKSINEQIIDDMRGVYSKI